MRKSRRNRSKKNILKSNRRTSKSRTSGLRRCKRPLHRSRKKKTVRYKRVNGTKRIMGGDWNLIHQDPSGITYEMYDDGLYYRVSYPRNTPLSVGKNIYIDTLITSGTKYIYRDGVALGVTTPYELTLHSIKVGKKSVLLEQTTNPTLHKLLAKQSVRILTFKKTCMEGRSIACRDNPA
jgi:hypothetical protein